MPDAELTEEIAKLVATYHCLLPVFCDPYPSASDEEDRKVAKREAREIAQKILDLVRSNNWGPPMRTAGDDILLPCPFCGSLRVGVFFSRNTYVECRTCGTRGPQIGDHVETDDQGAQRATQKWNQRISHKA